ncbi:leukocyte elastase inhibitor-like isoform X2 [Thalassophryne amazonica]|uniref:leukocyte elastase inhibitor-like isoform X2 n=1 Tax=Thalassophryne amazonica TaxID=390379 RepID=UPI0014723FFA|nr:leukocyte elastase inhibitor-like isoform X2 [Thalassophryne amazonica]
MSAPISLSMANTAFCLDLYKKLSEDERKGNIFYSSFSISSALAMTLLGTRGNTAAQISEVLHFNFAEGLEMQTQRQSICQIPCCTPRQNKADDIHVEFNKLLRELNKAGVPYELSVANRLFGELSFQFKKEYIQNTEKYYDASLEPMDFKNNSEAARVHINNWVEEKTKDKIKDLLPKDAVKDNTKLVLVNAIYFKGNWDKQFDKDKTSDAMFKLSKNESKPVKMMSQKGSFPFSFIEEINCQILEVPYKEKDLSMIIFLPMDIEDDTTGLEKLERELTYKTFVEWTSRLSDENTVDEVFVELPRFKMEMKYGLKNVLISMGMTDAFDASKSDFSGMSPIDGLMVSKVIHQAFVEVSEEGTEAAAATGVVVVERTLLIPKYFRADHPFLFFIRHNSTKNILFLGRFSTPE